MITLDFRKDSPDYLQSIPTHAGIIPDMPNPNLSPLTSQPRCGIFADEMPQTVITHAYNYHLDHIILQGHESQTYIDNLQRTLIPDILPNVTISHKP